MPLKELGMESTRIRRAMNGGLIIEIPGDDGAQKADGLADRLRKAVESMATVSRPTAKSEALLTWIRRVSDVGSSFVRTVENWRL